MENADQIFIDALKGEIDRRGYSLRRMAEYLNINASQISRYLSGSQSPSPAVRKSIFKKLGISEVVTHTPQSVTRALVAREPDEPYGIPKLPEPVFAVAEGTPGGFALVTPPQLWNVAEHIQAIPGTDRSKTLVIVNGRTTYLCREIKDIDQIPDRSLMFFFNEGELMLGRVTINGAQAICEPLSTETPLITLQLREITIYAVVVAELKAMF